MDTFFNQLFQSDFMPHGHCYFWEPDILWLHVLSDTLICLAYYSIPITLVYFAHKRRDLAYNWVFLMFGAFIFACGTTHLIDVLTTWVPTYRLEGVVKLLTAGISVATALVLVPLVPRALALPSPDQLRAINASLEREVAERRRAEDDLRQVRDQLEERVRERTTELEAANQRLREEVAERRRTEKDLERQAAELERSNAELQQFAYVASHDLQEPLRMVSSYVQLLSKRYREQLDEEADEFIDFAVDGALRMQELINGLLAFSRVNSSGLNFAAISCDEVLDKVLDNLKLTIDEAGARVSRTPLPTVHGDEIQLTQLLQNLVGNALKFHGEQRPHIHIAAQLRDQEWVFSISDNGIGIEAQYAERIFLIFQRLHTRSEYPGTGIGLALCKKIVERHEGRIWVESEPGKGSTFYFALPAGNTTPHAR